MKKLYYVDINLISVIINDCFYYNIFNKELYSQYKILTSSGIQKRYFNATNRRKELFLCKDYIIVDINGINVTINWINDDRSTQSKVKKRKVKDSKEKESIKSEETGNFNKDFEPIYSK
jgi:hypothetical protein